MCKIFLSTYVALVLIYRFWYSKFVNSKIFRLFSTFRFITSKKMFPKIFSARNMIQSRCFNSLNMISLSVSFRGTTFFAFFRFRFTSKQKWTAHPSQRYVFQRKILHYCHFKMRKYSRIEKVRFFLRGGG